MRYALIFAGVAAAYDAYGYGDSKASSSAPAPKVVSSSAYGYGNEYKTSSAAPSKHTSSSSKIGYTTITPGYGKQPVTVTSQYQPYPTCGAAGSDGKSCDKWNEGKYVSTVVEDYDSKKVTVTDVEKPITVYHTKSTITHYAPTASSSGGKPSKPYPTGSYGYDDKKNATQPWYELYEKVHEIKYKELGAHGRPGYPGSGLCKTCDDEQPYKVKEYKQGKWSEYETTAVYKAPTPETKVYQTPGVYTEPAKDVTVSYTMTKPTEATATAKSGVPVTYGGAYTDFTETGVKTCAYGAYETGKDVSGKDVTSTVVKTVTVTVTAPGKYEIAKPTTTVYDHDTEVAYPTITAYAPGVYHKDAQTITITKSGQSVSCDYKQTKTYPAGPKQTHDSGDKYPHGDKSSSKPVDSESKTAYKPDYPAATSSAPYPGYPVSTGYPSYNGYKNSTVPAHGEKSSSTYPAHGDDKKSSTAYPAYPATTVVPYYDASSSTPCPSSTPVYPVDGEKSSSTVYGEVPYPTPAYPEAAKSTPAHPEGAKPTGAEYPSSSDSDSYDSSKDGKDGKDGKDDKYTPTPVYPAATSSTPAAADYYPTPAAEKKDGEKKDGEKKDGQDEYSNGGYGYEERRNLAARRVARW
jgi:hypothetical protein